MEGKKAKYKQTLQDSVNPLGSTFNVRSYQEALQTAIRKNDDRSETSRLRISNLKKYGSGSLAYSSLQPGMLYFMHPDLGYIAYMPLSDGPDSVCVLADPICHDDNKKSLLKAFLAVKKDPVFLHINHHTATILNEMGFCVNELGVETKIDIQTFNLVGNKKQQLRNARNGARKDQLQVTEVTAVDDAILRALRRVSEEWIKEKVTADCQMQFLIRPLVFVDEVDVRKFVALKDREIVGFVIFDPMYENGEAVGYMANQLRSNLRRTYSIVDFIILEAMEKFKAEGKRLLSLGLSPFARVNDGDEFKHSKLLSAHFRYSFERANYLYNFKSLAEHKLKYRPEMPGAMEEKVYCAMRTRFLLVRLLNVYRVLGLHPVHKTAAHLIEKLSSILHPRRNKPQ